MMASHPTRSRFRLPLRYSLRTLLVFVTLLCVVLGVWLERARCQHEIVQAIRDTGGYVEYEIEDAKAEQDNIEPYWHRNPFGQDLLCCVRSVTISERRLLPHVARLRGVKSLSVEDSELTDADVQLVVAMHGLKAVQLTGNRRGWRFSGNPGLYRIHVSFFCEEVQLTDRAITTLSNHPTLEEIAIGGGDFSKAAIQRLAQMPNLRSIYVDYSETAKSTPHKDWLEPFRKLPNLYSITLLGRNDWAYTDSIRPWVVKDLRDWAYDHY